MAIQKISRDSISDQVFVQMKEQILEGEWKPGEKIPSENELGPAVRRQPGNGAQCPAEIICSGIAGNTIRRGLLCEEPGCRFRNEPFNTCGISQ